MDDKVIGETRFELAEQDGLWFPRRVECWQPDGSAPLSTVEILRAEFNRADHPNELGPADIGVEPGMSIDFLDGSRRGPMKWDGERPVDVDGYFDRVKRGELQDGVNYAREVARLAARDLRSARLAEAALAELAAYGSASRKTGVAPPMTVWEKYTRRVIAVYELDDDQSQRAFVLCREAQKHAGAVLSRRSNELAELERKLTALRQATGDDARVRRESLQTSIAALLAPLDAIFADQLKPRLLRLPTRAQIDAADKAGRVKPDVAIAERGEKSP